MKSASVRGWRPRRRRATRSRSSAVPHAGRLPPARCAVRGAWNAGRWNDCDSAAAASASSDRIAVAAPSARARARARRGCARRAPAQHLAGEGETRERIGAFGEHADHQQGLARIGQGDRCASCRRVARARQQGVQGSACARPRGRGAPPGLPRGTTRQSASSAAICRASRAVAARRSAGRGWSGSRDTAQRLEAEGGADASTAPAPARRGARVPLSSRACGLGRFGGARLKPLLRSAATRSCRRGRDALFPVHRIYCVGRNYAEHAREMGADPDARAAVLLQQACRCAGAVRRARSAYPPRTANLHHEIELVVAIGREGRGVARGGGARPRVRLCGRQRFHAS